MTHTGPETHDEQALWYKDAVIYELHVRAFRDSDADGIGDFRGLVSKLDYIADLGVTTIWLLPFYPSPLRDDGYDIAWYKGIHPSYGTLADFKLFLREARRHGLRVITELVINHTSDQHPLFQRARRSPRSSPWRDFYVWSDTPERYRDARIIFKDFEHSNWTWDPVADAYYWHRFYSHQPDLNFDNPAVREAVFDVLDFWLGLGVDGLRLDAVPYLFEREGTVCENLPETYEYLKELRAHVDRRFPNRMLLAEANQWPEDAVAYFGDGDACHMAFHFPLMPRMFMALRMEDRFPIIDILDQTPHIPETAQWALFLRNHDELTLEMVTDEERDYMYRAYAEDPQARINLGIRHRLAPLLGRNRRMIELMNGLLFSLPGTPVTYYGDEIGMGDNIYLGDRNGVRTPMQWSPDRNAGFSEANPQKLYLPVIIDPEYHAATVNVETQRNNPHSLLWWTKRLIALRRRHRAFGRGSLEFLHPRNRRVLVFVRTYGEERILVVANLSRFAQYVELDLSAFRDMTPVELFGGTEFPRVGELPYLLTLGPHAFYWFLLQPQTQIEVTARSEGVPTLEVAGRWPEVLTTRARASLEAILPAYLLARRWFGGKARRIKSVQIADVVPVPGRDASAPAGYMTLVQVEYREGDPETYALPLTALGDEWGDVQDGRPPGLVARLQTVEGERLLVDAMWDGGFADALLEAIGRRRRLSGGHGKLVASRTSAYRKIRGPVEEALPPSVLQVEQSNTSVVYGDRLILKLIRRPESGVNPDLEVGSFLTEGAFPHTPPVAGALEYVRGRAAPMTIGILQGFVPNEGDVWEFTLDALRDYMEERLARLAREPDEEAPLPSGGLLELAGVEPTPLAADTLGTYLESARLLGRRTGEMHLALASDHDDPSFAPEPFTPMYQRSVYQRMRSLTDSVFRLLRSQVDQIPVAVQILDLKEEILGRFHRLRERKISGVRMRCHGDFHLGQVLFTGKDFVIIDFEGEPIIPLGQRRIKRSPLRDVAGMLRSFHYAGYSALFGRTHGVVGSDDPSTLEPWIVFWYRWVSAAFLGAYLDVVEPAGILPGNREETALLLEVMLLEKALYEVGYEVNNRPDWVKIPIEGILQLLEEPA
jgi:maltose alpha-D-glucosyltransferase / alpha-amylase